MLLMEISPGVEISVYGPRTAVLQNRTFNIRVEVTNGTGEIHTLDHIGFYIDDEESSEVVNADPNFSIITRDFPYQTYRFEKEIKPGETLTISLEMKAKVRGSYPISLRVCINTPINCQGYDLYMVVK